MTLPVPLKMPVGDTPLSFASALAYQNGFSSLRLFLRAAGIKPGALAQGETKATTKLAYWSGEDSSTISRFTIPLVVHRTTWTLGGAQFNKDARKGARYRFCPRCVESDFECAESGTTSLPFVRAPWLSRAFKNCTVHEIPLSELPVPKKTHEDFVQLTVQRRLDIEQMAYAAEKVSSCELDRYVEACIMGTATDSYLDRFETSVAVDLCNYLGQFLKRHRSTSLFVPATSFEGSAREIGFAVACQGEEVIRATVSSVITNAPRDSSKEFQFGTLGLWLKRNLKNPAHADVVELFQDIAERSLPVGPGDVCFLPVRRRHLHSVSTAAKEYGLFDKRVYRLVHDAGLIEPTDRPYHEVCFSAASAHAILLEAADALTSREARDLLGLKENIFAKLLNDGLIPRVELAASGRIYSRIRRSDLDAFTQAVFANADGKLPTANHLLLGAACQKLGFSQPALLSKIVAGTIKNTAAEQNHSSKVSRIWVDVEEAKAASLGSSSAANRVVDGHPAVYMTVHEAARHLRTINMSVTALIQQRFLVTEITRNRTCDRRQSYIRRDSVIAFGATHISIADLAIDNGTHPVIVRRALERWGINPVNDSPGRVARFFLRSEVAHLTFEKPARKRRS